MHTIALVAAGTRLGLALGRAFGAHGFRVALLARSPTRLDRLSEQLAADGVTAAGFPCDVTDPATLTSALDAAAERLGAITALQYSAPYVPVGDAMTAVLDVTADNLRPQLEATCFGAITAARAVLPGMIARGDGTLLFTTGASAVVPSAWAATAGAAGAALRNWAVNLNGALAEQGVYAAHVAIGAWLSGTPGMPAGVTALHPDEVARVHWELHAARGPAEQLITT